MGGSVTWRPPPPVTLLFYVLVNSNWVHPSGNPLGLAQKTCPGGQDLTFESCPGTGNSTRTGILRKMKVKFQKNSVDQIFTGVNEKKVNFLGLGVFPGLWVNFLVLLSITHTLQKIWGVVPGLFMFEVFTGLGYPHLLLYKRLWLC